MSYQFNLSYYYLTHENKTRLEDFGNASGDSKQTLVTQFVRGWLGRNRAYYTHLAKLDLTKRGIDPDRWVNIVLEEGFDGLPDYKSPISRDELPENPLSGIILPKTVIKDMANYIYLTKQNYLLVRTAIHYDGSAIALFVSKIIHEHLQRNWASLYASQMEAEHSSSWLL